MSYEGYEQVICAKGHLSERDAYEQSETCHICNAAVAWTNQVDQTNWDDVGFIPQEEFDKLLIEAAVYESCNLGHAHLMSPATYRIPKPGELQRFYKDYEQNYKLVPYEKNHI